jgi:hypothetical protein
LLDGRNGLHQRHRHLRIVDVGASAGNGQRRLGCLNLLILLLLVLLFLLAPGGWRRTATERVRLTPAGLPLSYACIAFRE